MVNYVNGVFIILIAIINHSLGIIMDVKVGNNKLSVTKKY